ncbi:hypothetical protein [Saccharopolyspora tripterygii]
MSFWKKIVVTVALLSAAPIAGAVASAAEAPVVIATADDTPWG